MGSYELSFPEVRYTFQDLQEARDRGIEITAYEADGDEESIKEKLVAARRKGFRSRITANTILILSIKKIVLATIVLFLDRISLCVHIPV